MPRSRLDGWNDNTRIRGIIQRCHSVMTRNGDPRGIMAFDASFLLALLLLVLGSGCLKGNVAGRRTEGPDTRRADLHCLRGPDALVIVRKC